MEANLRHCKTCKTLKSRILVGKFDKLNKKWSDETGALWNGSNCPACHVNKSKDNMQKLRNVRRALEETDGKSSKNS